MAGIWLEQAFPVYQQGFPPEVMEEFEKRIGRKTMGNKPASGTEIIKELGEEHVRTGKPIVYTSGDSVFQIAAHEEVIPVAELYRMCEIARKLLDGKHRVGRVIARPFTGAPGISRGHRGGTIMPWNRQADAAGCSWRNAACRCLGLARFTIFTMGAAWTSTSRQNRMPMGWRNWLAAARERKDGLIFCNLVDFDMLYGHRKDVEGFAKSLEEFDVWLAAYLKLLNERDLLMITADHGCDPDPRWETTDHSREYVPILAYAPANQHGRIWECARRWRTWGRRWRRILAGRFRTGRAFLGELG